MLTDDQWARFVKAGRDRVFAEGTPVIRQGDRDGSVFLLLEGTVKVTMVREDGTGLLLALRGPGESLGEFSALSGLPRSATVMPSSGRCRTRVLTSEQFRLLVKSMRLEQALWEHVVQRQTESESLRAEMAALPAGQRLAATLLRLAQLVGSDVEHVASTRRSVVVRLGLSQRELGDSIGLSRAAVANEFRQLRRLDVVRTGREYVVIRNVARLKAVAEGVGP
ncbi:Crp/Fnr family transcriptional regulator [Streptomonospora nanhaiensis]|uniref:Crp/Fnr family transcriptional regulator n=1 Tax=Streptomonospora nanhaiensis TaxID=1323731 RepID=UPI001FE8AB5A|nr:Crp/Fnr family transcriptional regulator [Streptomonospora nanhaiensis]